MRKHARMFSLSHCGSVLHTYIIQTMPLLRNIQQYIKYSY